MEAKASAPTPPLAPLLPLPPLPPVACAFPLELPLLFEATVAAVAIPPAPPKPLLVVREAPPPPCACVLTVNDVLLPTRVSELDAVPALAAVPFATDPALPANACCERLTLPAPEPLTKSVRLTEAPLPPAAQVAKLKVVGLALPSLTKHWAALPGELGNRKVRLLAGALAPL